jgi:hypothetical protein
MNIEDYINPDMCFIDSNLDKYNHIEEKYVNILKSDLERFTYCYKELLCFISTILQVNVKEIKLSDLKNFDITKLQTEQKFIEDLNLSIKIHIKRIECLENTIKEMTKTKPDDIILEEKLCFSCDHCTVLEK